MRLNDIFEIDHIFVAEESSVESIPGVIELVKGEDDDERQKYAKEVFDLLQQSYEPVGGIHGTGFKNPNEMQDKIPVWVLYVEDGKVLAALMHKIEHNDHLKRVALGVARSTIPRPEFKDEENMSDADLAKKEKYIESVKAMKEKRRHIKDVVSKIIKLSLKDNLTYGEVSGPSLKFIKESVFKGNMDELKSHLVPVNKVAKILGKPVTPDSSEHAIEGYSYTRVIGGKHHSKVMIGLGYLMSHPNSRIKEQDVEVHV